jgi:hypothetical protein
VTVLVGIIGLFGSLIRKVLFLALVVGGLGGFAYYRYAAGQLPEAGLIRSSGVCKPTPSLSGGGVPLTFETYEKLDDQHNWLLAPRDFGLVSRRLEWSHAGQRWVEDTAFVERQGDAVAARAELTDGSVDELIDRLASVDAVTREVAAKELRIRTGETLGYRYDATAEDRRQAVERWIAWWKDPKNKARYGAGKAIEVVDEVLDILRRATGPDGDEGNGGQ